MFINEHVQSWEKDIYKFRTMFHALNQFNENMIQKCVVGEAWVPAMDIIKLNEVCYVEL